MDKKGIRNLGKLLRKDGKKEGFEKAAYGFLKSLPEYEKASCIMLYLSLPDEAPTDEIKKWVLADGKRVCVPVTDGQNMIPSEIDKNTEYVNGNFNVREPLTVKEMDANDIDMVIAPGLLFDRRGTRCGYGKGYYDLFLQDASAIAVGLCYDKQLIHSFPSEEHDVKMKYIVTEKELVVCEK